LFHFGTIFRSRGIGAVKLQIVSGSRIELASERVHRRVVTGPAQPAGDRETHGKLPLFARKVTISAQSNRDYYLTKIAKEHALAAEAENAAIAALHDELASRYAALLESLDTQSPVEEALRAANGRDWSAMNAVNRQSPASSSM
jgi:hypothetical protein